MSALAALFFAEACCVRNERDMSATCVVELTSRQKQRETRNPLVRNTRVQQRLVPAGNACGWRRIAQPVHELADDPGSTRNASETCGRTNHGNRLALSCSTNARQARKARHSKDCSSRFSVRSITCDWGTETDTRVSADRCEPLSTQTGSRAGTTRNAKPRPRQTPHRRTEHRTGG